MMAVVNWDSLLNFYLTILLFLSEVFLLILWIIAFRRLRLPPFAILIVSGVVFVFITAFNVAVGSYFHQVHDLFRGHYEAFERFLNFLVYIAIVMKVIGFALLVRWMLRHNRPNQAMQPTASPRTSSLA